MYVLYSNSNVTTHRKTNTTIGNNVLGKWFQNETQWKTSLFIYAGTWRKNTSLYTVSVIDL